MQEETTIPRDWVRPFIDPPPLYSSVLSCFCFVYTLLFIADRGIRFHLPLFSVSYSYSALVGIRGQQQLTIDISDNSQLHLFRFHHNSVHPFRQQIQPLAKVCASQL